MSKIDLAIVTMSYGNNYGNKLQNYAMQVIYESMGFSVETIRLKPCVCYSEGIKEKFNNIGGKIQRKIQRIVYKKNINNRKEVFEKFNNERLFLSEKIYAMNDYHSLNDEKYKIYSVGSDQVWNTYFDEFTSVYLLDCLDNKKTRISYAASLGCDSINPLYKEKFKEELKKFKCISVREEEGKKVLEKFPGITAKVVLDPTLLLSQNDWDKFIGTNELKEKNKYILTYFLGKMEPKMKRTISQYAKKNKLKIINLNDIATSYYYAGPVEFVNLIKNAQIIFTDSFHACCFSIIYEKTFWVVSRNSVKKNMNSRINTLLKRFGLEERWWNETVDLKKIPDYNVAYEKLQNLRKDSYEFLEKAIDSRE